MERGVRLGLVPGAVFHVERRRWARREAAIRALEETRLTPSRETRRRLAEIAGVEIAAPASWAQLLRRQDLDPAALAEHIGLLGDLDREERDVVVSRVRYAGYLERHRRELERVRRLGAVAIPETLLEADLPGLSREVRDALARYRPRTLAEAERLPGVTPAAVAILAGRLAGRRGGGGARERRS